MVANGQQGRIYAGNDKEWEALTRKDYLAPTPGILTVDNGLILPPKPYKDDVQSIEMRVAPGVFSGGPHACFSQFLGGKEARVLGGKEARANLFNDNLYDYRLIIDGNFLASLENSHGRKARKPRARCVDGMRTRFQRVEVHTIGISPVHLFLRKANKHTFACGFAIGGDNLNC